MKRWKLLQKLMYTNRSRLTLNTRAWSNMNYIQPWKLWNQFFTNFIFWCCLKSSENRKGFWNHKIRRLTGVCIRYWKVRLAGIFYINCRFAKFTEPIHGACGYFWAGQGTLSFNKQSQFWVDLFLVFRWYFPILILIVIQTQVFACDYFVLVAHFKNTWDGCYFKHCWYMQSRWCRVRQLTIRPETSKGFENS